MSFNRLLIKLFISSVICISSSWSAFGSDWVETHGAKMRLLHAEKTDNNGQLTGVIHVRLDRGWKTYWREPGESGIPPTFSFSSGDEAVTAKLYFPTPATIDDGYVRYAGYRDDVYFPFSLDLKYHSTKAPLKLDAFIGVCEQICVPFSAQFEIIVGAEDQNLQGKHDSIIKRAFADLPQSQSNDFEIIAVEANQSTNHIKLTAQLPEFYPTHFEPELFLDGPDVIYIEQPVLIEKDSHHAHFQAQFFGATDRLTSQQIDLYTLLTLGPRTGEKIITFRFPDQ